MNGWDWSGLAFVANPGNVPLTLLPPWVSTLAVQVAWGTTPQDLGSFVEDCYGRYYLVAWAWCQGDDIEGEAELHGRLAQGYVGFIANMEEPYDGHGNQNDPRFRMPGRYLDALVWDGPLGVTTTPKFGSDLTAWQGRGAVYMPQAFPLENFCEIDDAVEHGVAWGWPVERQRPLAQCYTTNEQRPNGGVMNEQASGRGIGLVPYVIEQAMDAGGQLWLEQVRPSVERPTKWDEEEPMPDEPEWWEVPYSGGPMVPVDGFPRPVYPPDAAGHGKKPSVDGPDIEAYKRTVSRAGRWKWQEFDDSFSNGFSHGKGPNVIDSGVAGVQRQMHLDATGWIGQKTFNTLRSIRVPEGKQHAGEMAMDATAQRLLNEAWKQFQGHEPVESEFTRREAALQKALTQLGQHESPSGSNLNKYGEWYGMNGEPWCAMFVTWCYELNDVGESPSFVKGSRYAYCPYIVADAREGRYGLKTTDDPIPGDLVVYDWSWDTIFDHVGLFEGWLGGIGEFTAIEGNTSESNNSNGGQVMRRERSRSDANIVFVRVAE